MTISKWVIGGVFIALQIFALVVYFLVESKREIGSMSVEPPKASELRVDSFMVSTKSGPPLELVGARPKLLHFWATWCEPCRDELPLVLDLPKDLPFEVVVVSLDPEWRDIEAFLPAEPHRVVRANAKEAESLFNIPSLPHTLLLMPNGEVVLSVNGARNWADEGFLKTWTQSH